mmetsp:Transcript_43612/g.64735  ORF Transcript_43612/g.64735 Transcript_43612/m.64735 type:complete len:184 (-) Transcript_43612:320-871(-)|eukprot:CAMPEP_0194034106 /NCGR_PEP_ID=MMETSP0009_2-20130614/6511_1 /TAXON_ID=210454 /ORGANISM="Grammatophora oceanica, Strain CCMP 410" /LENGTH=183 /DNA_ID=CAMNT_0038674863 /DNA_START=74 /DNA_END=625 /DNA_ORIENTATION=-
MKLSFALLPALLVGTSNAFSVNSAFHTRSSTRLNLFGGGGDKPAAAGGGGGGAGMLQQMAAFKKAQEVLAEKAKLEKELSGDEFSATGADGKVTTVMKYVPAPGAMGEPTLGVESFAFDDDWFQGASVDDVKAGVKEAYEEGKKEIAKAVQEKFAPFTEKMAKMQTEMAQQMQEAQAAATGDK